MDLLNNYVTQGITVASFIIIIICMFHSKYTYIVLCKAPGDWRSLPSLSWAVCDSPSRLQHWSILPGPVRAAASGTPVCQHQFVSCEPSMPLAAHTPIFLCLIEGFLLTRCSVRLHSPLQPPFCLFNHFSDSSWKSSIPANTCVHAPVRPPPAGARGPLQFPLFTAHAGLWWYPVHHSCLVHWCCLSWKVRNCQTVAFPLPSVILGGEIPCPTYYIIAYEKEKQWPIVCECGGWDGWGWWGGCTVEPSGQWYWRCVCVCVCVHVCVCMCVCAHSHTVHVKGAIVIDHARLILAVVVNTDTNASVAG